MVQPLGVADHDAFLVQPVHVPTYIARKVGQHGCRRVGRSPAGRLLGGLARRLGSSVVIRRQRAGDAARVIDRFRYGYLPGWGPQKGCLSVQPVPANCFQIGGFNPDADHFAASIDPLRGHA